MLSHKFGHRLSKMLPAVFSFSRIMSIQFSDTDSDWHLHALSKTYVGKLIIALICLVWNILTK